MSGVWEWDGMCNLEEHHHGGGALLQRKARVKSGGKAPPLQSERRPFGPMGSLVFSKLPSNLCYDLLTLQRLKKALLG